VSGGDYVTTAAVGKKKSGKMAVTGVIPFMPTLGCHAKTAWRPGYTRRVATFAHAPERLSGMEEQPEKTWNSEHDADVPTEHAAHVPPSP
jgi:hypothetical protein